MRLSTIIWSQKTVSLFTIICILSFSKSFAACNHTIRLTDTYGDGWNGGTVKVQVNGVDVLTNVGSTFTSGAGPINVTLSCNSGDVITVVETAAGSWPAEMRVEVLDGTSTSLGAAFDPSSGGTSFNGLCPGPMSYSSSTVTQSSSASVENCSTNEQIVRLEVVMSGSTSALNLTQIRSNFQGTSAVSAVSSAKIYYTGTSSTFSTSSLFGSSAPTVATYNINGSQTLVNGTNYFWLVYDLNNTGTVANTIDAVISQITVGGTNYVPTATNPAGTRAIVACASYPSTSALGRKNWVKSDAGVTTSGASVTSWADQSGAAITGNMVPVGAAATQPTLVSAAMNYQNAIRFDGSDDGLRSTNAVTAVTSGLYSNTDNTVFLVKNIRTGGIPVDYKWETDGSGPTRIGFELNGSSQRFDFVDDGNGQNSLSTVNITNKNYIVGGVTNSTNAMVRLNGLLDATKAHGGLSMGGAGATTGYLYLGCNDITDFAYYSNVDIAEEITFNKTLSASELLMVESYLAVKYGITLGTSAVPSNYMNSSGSTIWYGQSTYQNNVIGIGRDDVSTLNQKQSHNADDSVRIYLSTITATNAANSGSFSVNNSYVISGATTGKMCSSAASVAEMPAACTLYSRIEREWKITRTNMAQNFNMDFKLNACANLSNVVVADLRILVDDDGNFANGGTSCYYNGDGSGIVISYSNPTITVTGISTTLIPNNSTRFITVASVQQITPLPTELLSFTAALNDKRTVDINWTTASEINSDYFVVEKTVDGTDWSLIGAVDAAGFSSSILNYYLLDPTPVFGKNYYRLKQYDLNGEFEYSDIRVVDLRSLELSGIYPNPATNSVVVFKDNIESHIVNFYDNFGKEIEVDIIATGNALMEFDLSTLSGGIYYVRISDQSTSEMFKLVVNK